MTEALREAPVDISQDHVMRFVACTTGLSEESVREVLTDAFHPDRAMSPMRTRQCEDIRRKIPEFFEYARGFPEHDENFCIAVMQHRSARSSETLLKKSDALHQEMAGVVVGDDDPAGHPVGETSPR